MRDFAKISTSIWGSEKFNALPNDGDAKLLYFYLHTCPSVNSVGCFVLKPGYAAADLHWPEERYFAALETLRIQYLIQYQDSQRMVRIVDFLRFNPFANPKHAIGAIKIAKALPDCEEKANLLREIAACKHVSEGMISYGPDTVSKPSRYTETETETPEVGGVGGREAVQPPSNEAKNLWTEVMAAVGHKSGRIPGYWMPPAAVVHVNRWVTDLNLTPAQVIEAARLSRSNYPEPPNGPKALDRVMQNYAEALHAPPLQPTPPTATRGKRNDRTERDRAFNDNQRQLVQDLRDGKAEVRPAGRDPFAP